MEKLGSQDVMLLKRNEKQKDEIKNHGAEPVPCINWRSFACRWKVPKFEIHPEQTPQMLQNSLAEVALDSSK